MLVLPLLLMAVTVCNPEATSASARYFPTDPPAYAFISTNGKWQDSEGMQADANDGNFLDFVGETLRLVFRVTVCHDVGLPMLRR